MPDLESQLRVLAERLDATVEPVRADDITVADMTLPRQRAPRLGAGRAAAAIIALAAVIAGVIAIAHRTNDSAPTLTPATAAPVTSAHARTARGMCLFAHTDLYTLREPITIT